MFWIFCLKSEIVYFVRFPWLRLSTRQPVSALTQPLSERWMLSELVVERQTKEIELARLILT